MKEQPLTSHCIPDILRELTKLALEVIMQAERAIFRACECPATGRAASTPTGAVD